MRKYIILGVSLGFVLGVNIYFRSYPINFPQLKIQAKDIIEQRVYQDAAMYIHKNFSEFNSRAKEKLVNAYVLDYKRQNKNKIKSQIQQEYFKLKDRFQDTQGQTYLMELDCWHWARYTDNVLKLGHPGDKVVNGKQVDSLMLAPNGSIIPWNHFLFYFSAFLYKIFSFFKDIPLNTFLFYLPLFFTVIFITTLYLFCYRYWGNLCAVIACLFVGLSHSFLYRSCAGWFDMDVLNLLFPLLIVWTYLLSYKTQIFKKKVFWIFISGFWVGLFCFTWPNWWFIFLIVIIYEIYSLLNSALIYIQYKEKNTGLFKQHILSLFLFSLFAVFWIFIFSGIQPLQALYQQVKEALVLNKPSTFSIWPNVFSTVAELNLADYAQMMNYIGGPILFIISVASVLFIFMHSLRNIKYTDFQHQVIVILILWFIIMFFACFRGVRFTMFLLIPLGVSLGWMLKKIYDLLEAKKWIVFIFAAVIFIVTLCNASNNAEGVYPLMNDAWYKVLINIKDKTVKDAIINSWWDFGDWFKAVSNRRVIFDGQSQNTPQGYWMGHVFVTPDEEEAIKILRMLNNGGNKAFEIIDNHIKNPFESIALLNKAILSKTQAETKEILTKKLPSSSVKELIKLLFDRPDKTYFVVDYTMPDKMSAISFIGNWDFAKLYLARNINKEKKERIISYLSEFGIDNRTANRLFDEAGVLSDSNWDNWISPRIRFYSSLMKGKANGEVVLFDNGLVYNPKKQTVYVYSSRDNKYMLPKSLFVFKQDKLDEIVYPDSELDFSVLIIKSKESYRAILLDRRLVNSIFVRLYFLDGKGLKYFKPFIEEKDSDSYIKVYEIIWD